jgi:hypothetical protein
MKMAMVLAVPLAQHLWGHNMNLFDKIIETYPELTNADFGLNGSIGLRNDSDGIGDYIEKWEYSKPIPEGLTLGKPSA